MLREFSRNTQFLVITHNKLTMETANHLYGVTMMEPGCSSIVSVSFHDVAESQSDQELAGAIAARRRGRRPDREQPAARRPGVAWSSPTRRTRRSSRTRPGPTTKMPTAAAGDEVAESLDPADEAMEASE